MAALLGLPWGLPWGLAAAIAAGAWLRGLSSLAAARQREALAAELPLVAELLAACVAAGVPVDEALDVVCEASRSTVHAALDPVLTGVRLGLDPATAWGGICSDPLLAPLARPIARAYASGAPLADALNRAVEDLRAAARSRAEAAAERASVHIAAPLGLCFLPAFVLVGVLPLVVSASAAVSTW